MKKLTALLLACMLICTYALLCGCKKKEASPFPPAPEDEQIATPKINMIGGPVLSEDECSWSIPIKEDFKIMILADLQADSVGELDGNFDSYLDKTVEINEPDLIVLTGDNIDANADPLTVDRLIERMESYGILWAPVFGNHDAENVITKAEYTIKFAAAEHCLFLPGEKEINGVGNYAVNLCDGERTVFSLFMLDSNEYRGDWYDYIYPSQIAWYERAVTAIKNNNGGRTVPSLAFFHIELPEFQDACDQYLQEPTGEHFDVREKLCPPRENTGMFDKMLELGSTKAVFCGHDHVNCFDLSYKGIRLNFALKSSTGSYYAEDMLGVKTVTLNEGREPDIDLFYFSELPE